MRLLLDTNAFLVASVEPERLGSAERILADARNELPHALAVADLPAHHSDPFDRLLVATAQMLGATVVTSDEVFERYEVDVLRY